MDQGTRDRRALLHAAGQLVRIPVLELGEADCLEQLAGARQMVSRPPAAQLDLHEHVAEHRPPVQQDRLLEHDPDLGDRAVHSPAVNRDPPAVRRHEPGDQSEQRALAAA
jgi:hypothetical protein